MVDSAGAVAAIVVLALVTAATRLGGVWIMSFVAISPRVEAFLKHMAVAVLIAIVVPATLDSSPRIWLAVAASIAVVLVTRNTLGAMLAGIVLAAAARGVGL
jgi:uncharacterized membrane protein